MKELSSKRTFRKISKEQAQVIWSIVKKTPTGWKHISKAARRIGVSRQTIYDFLQEHPEPERTRKLQPKYVEDFRKSEGYKKIYRYNKEIRRTRESTFKQRMNFARRCWLFLGKRDPVGWTKEDFHELRNNAEWFDRKLDPPQMGLSKLVMLRSYMEALEHSEWTREFRTVGSKRAAGRKRHWYLRENEVRAIFKEIKAYDASMLFIMACYTGNRISAYMKAKFGDLHLDVEGWETWTAYESKTKQYNENELNPELIELLREYIDTMKRANLYGHDKRIFPRRLDFYVQHLRDGLRRAGLAETCTHPRTKKVVDYCIHGNPISWHITRHTFASLLAQSGAPLQHIMDQGPWSDAKTLLDFYAGTDRAKVRESMSKLKLIGG